MKSAYKLTVCSMLTAAAIVLGWVEHMLPVSIGIPGVKLGLGNIVIVTALYILGIKEAAAVSAAKVMLCALLFGGISGLMYSAAGAAVSLAAMLCVYRCKNVSIVGTSALGGGAHVCAQVLVAMAVTSTPQLWRLLPPLLAIGVLTGTLTGVLALITSKRLTALRKDTTI